MYRCPYQTALISACEDEAIRSSRIGGVNNCTGLAVSRDFVATVTPDGRSISVSKVRCINAQEQSVSKAYRSQQPVHVGMHSQDVTDLSFSPHNPRVLASTGGDDSLRIWDIAVSEDAPFESADSKINVTNRLTLTVERPTSIAWHPAVRDLMAVGSRTGVVIVSTSASHTGSRVLAMIAKPEAGVPGQTVTRLVWSNSGALLALSGKDDRVYVVDVRAALGSALSGSISAEAKEADAPRYTLTAKELVSTGDLQDVNALLITGEDSTERLLVIGNRPPRVMTARFYDITGDTFTETHRADFGGVTGVPLVALDHTRGLLYHTARSLSTITIYDVSAQKDPIRGTVKQQFNQVTRFNNPRGASILGMALGSQHRARVIAGEIDHIYYAIQNSVELAAVTVTRRITQFHPDLFPDVRSSEPALDLSQWISGQNPLYTKVSLAPQKATPAASATPATTSATTPAASVAAPPASSSSVSDSSPSAALERKSGAFPAYTTRTASGSVAKPMFYRSPYQHIVATEPTVPRTNETFDLPPRENLMLGRAFAANRLYYAVPLRDQGVLIRNIAATGRVVTTGLHTVRIPECGRICGLAMTDFDPYLLATCHDDGIVSITLLPTDQEWPNSAEGKTPSLPFPITRAHVSIGLQGRPVMMKFHPYVPHVLFVATYSPSHGDAIYSISLHDFRSAALSSVPRSEWNYIHSRADPEGNGDEYGLAVRVYQSNSMKGRITDMDFSPYGHKMAFSDSECNVYLISIPLGRHLGSFKPAQNQIEVHVRFVGENELATIGFSRNSERSVSIYDVSNEEFKAKVSKPITFPGAARMHVTYDTPTGLLLVADLGEMSVHTLHITPEHDPYVHYLNRWQSRGDLCGMSVLHKSLVNVRAVEVLKMLKMSNSGEVWTVSFTVPRRRTEFFQDDLYNLGCPSLSPSLSNSEYFTRASEESGGKAPRYDSLCPPGMTPLSQAPAEVNVAQLQQEAAEAAAAALAAEKTINALGHRTAEETRNYFIQRAQTTAITSGRFGAKGCQQDDVAEDEW